MSKPESSSQLRHSDRPHQANVTAAHRGPPTSCRYLGPTPPLYPGSLNLTGASETLLPQGPLLRWPCLLPELASASMIDSGKVHFSREKSRPCPQRGVAPSRVTPCQHIIRPLYLLGLLDS